MNLGKILEKATAQLRTVPGVEGVVLGGSRARGTERPDSDIDIGIYYRAEVLDTDSLDAATATLDDEGRTGLLAVPGEWGPWVDGGAWLTVDGCSVDLILRDLARVDRCLGEVRSGIVTRHYQTGHPHAFTNAMYVGELAVCRVLWDASGAVDSLKRLAEGYPPQLGRALVHLFSFEAGFSAALAAANIERDDPYYVAAHVARSVSCLNQVIFALNGAYLINEKRAVGMADAMSLRPERYKERIDAVFTELGNDPVSACRRLDGLVGEVKELAVRPVGA